MKIIHPRTDGEAEFSDEEVFIYQLLCASLDPDLINYVYATAAFTCTEKSYFFGIEDCDIGAYARGYVNLTVGERPQIGGLPVLQTFDTGEIISFPNATMFLAYYVKHSDVIAISNARETFYTRLKYLVETIPTRYKVTHTAANELIETALTVTGKAILGSVALRATHILGVALDNGVNRFANYFEHGYASGAGGTADYTYKVVRPLFPMRAIGGVSWYLKSYSAALFGANLCNAYCEVFDNLPTPPF